jgi:hypothetical protein
VGVLREEAVFALPSESAPRAPEGASLRLRSGEDPYGSSPRTWGCFAQPESDQPSPLVFPTHVGVLYERAEVAAGTQEPTWTVRSPIPAQQLVDELQENSSWYRPDSAWGGRGALRRRRGLAACMRTRVTTWSKTERAASRFDAVGGVSCGTRDVRLDLEPFTPNVVEQNWSRDVC